MNNEDFIIYPTKDEIIEIMSSSKNIKEWNENRRNLFVLASLEENKSFTQQLYTLVDCSGLIVKVLPKKHFKVENKGVEDESSN